MTALRIGCSGWTYKDWTGPFYPPGTKDRERLEYYASRFDTSEINASFYRLPSEAMVEGWARRAPAGFVFAWKVSRFITHNKKLKDCADSVALVFGRMAPLGAKQGPALTQLPPQLRRNDERLAAFLALLPKGGRHTVEFRHDSWYDPAVFRILADHDAALCISDHHSAPSPWEVTASFVYVRGHGPGGRYHGRYPEAELQAWADRIAAWRANGRDAYVYFDNDIKSAAPFDAETLKRLTGVAADRASAA
ncbi:DUF72 domain-containing protein [Phenylobacterium hankyongense]|uniref:DUF72 domain-containing protein n=1 Tax=Phenylobacterium hankyongense TaxID=1813876 RepID=A0A328AZW8_9CAUL|nr:DUF72 domain-containing protein [Phenylobacterium hankyongense]RAK59226.1 DUF72 domain-containing protein [Phenylobacterium hankyongense]